MCEREVAEQQALFVKKLPAFVEQHAEETRQIAERMGKELASSKDPVAAFVVDLVKILARNAEQLAKEVRMVDLTRWQVIAASVPLGDGTVAEGQLLCWRDMAMKALALMRLAKQLEENWDNKDRWNEGISIW